MSDTLFELSCNQTITPTTGTYTGADNNTPVYELVDSDYYLKNTSSHGYYYFNVVNTASRMKVSFDCVFNYKSGFNWIFLFENTQGQNWWGIGSYYSGLELRGTSTSAQTLKTNIANGTKLHIDIQIEHSTLANIVTILIDNIEVLNISLPSTYELSNFELLGNTSSYTSNCYIKDLSIVTYGTDYLNKSGLFEIWANIKNYITAQLLGKSNTEHTHTKSEITDFPTIPTKTSDLTNDSGFLTSHQDLSGYVPRSGGAVMTGDLLASSTTNSIGFGYGWGRGGTIYTYSPTHSTVDWQGTIRLEPLKTTSNFKTMQLAPGGTWTWNGTACQITSDQRYKQQITEIDDKLLDAWEDVELVQFKYNESVDTKGKSARLHTGYVVQQIDSACKSHGVDISEYGLYCHEEYPEETKEVEVEQADGTKTKETKVIREANEHYSLRYTEVYAVECMYLRRCIKQLTARIEELEKGNNSK